MATAQELLIDRFVAAAAIARGQFGCDHKSVMIFLLLARRGLVALKAIDPFAGMRAHLVLVNDRILSTGVAFRAFPCRAHQIGGRLIGFDLGTSSVNQKRGEDKRERNDDGNEDGTERHDRPQKWK